MKILQPTMHKQPSTSELLRQRPTRSTGLLSVLGMLPTKRFAQYLQGNDIADLQRDARVIANDMNTVIPVRIVKSELSGSLFYITKNLQRFPLQVSKLLPIFAVLKNSCNQLRRATVSAQLQSRAFLLPLIKPI